MEFEKSVLDKLDKIETTQVEHTVQLALNNTILDEHQKRSTQLELRLLPIEDHVKFLMKLSKLAVIAFSCAAALATVIGLFLKN